MTSDSRNEKLSEIITGFGDSTSMHGISRVLARNHRNNRCYWKNATYCTLLLSCIAVAVWSIWTLVEDYLTYPVNTDVSLTYEKSGLFPSVTFCNYNRNVLGKTNPRWIQTQPTEESDKGHLYYNMVKYCTLSNSSTDEDCRDRNLFFWHYDRQYGNCFTFNHDYFYNGTKRTPTIIRSPTVLYLTLNIEGDRYSGRQNSRGSVFVIHPLGQHPFPKEGNIGTPPGFNMNVKVSKQRTEHQPHPYSKCVVVSQEMNEALSFYADFWSYSQAACLDTCRQVERVKLVGCCMPPLPCNPLNRSEIFGVKLHHNLTYCDPDVYVQGSTENSLLNKYGDLPEGCKQLCPRPCEEFEYDYVSTLREFPSEGSTFEKKYFKKFKDGLRLPR